MYLVSVAKAFHHFVLHPEEHVDTEINSNDHKHDFNEEEFPNDMEHIHEHNDEAEDFLNVLNYLVSFHFRYVAPSQRLKSPTPS